MTDQLKKVPYASVYNFQPWTAKNKNSKLTVSLQYADKLMKELRRTNIVKPVPVYPLGEEKRALRHKTFYTLKYNGDIAFDMLRHQSGLMDIFLGFINLYPDCIIEIDTKKTFAYEKEYRDNNIGKIQKINKKYNPDAFIKITTLDNKEYHFIIELERSKGHKDIRHNKFEVINSLKKFENYGISRHTKFLFFYTTEHYNVYTRPIEYRNEDTRRQQQFVEHSLYKLIKDNQDILNDNYRFISFHDYFNLNEAKFLNSKIQKVSLIS